MGLAFAKSRSLLSNNIPENDLEDDVFDTTAPVIIEKVHIEGVKRTDASLIAKQVENVLNVKSFDALLDSANEAKLRLQRLGIFKAVEVFIDISREENASPDGLEVHFIVEEARRATANLGTNVGDNEGSMIIGAKLNNLRGVGDCIKSDISIGTRSSSSYELAFACPINKNPDCRVAVRLYQSTIDLVQSCFKQKSSGIGCEFAIPSPIGLHSLKYDGQWRQNTDVPLAAPFSVREQCGHSQKSAIQHSLISDGRNDSILPKSGNLFKHMIEFSGLGGDVKYIKSELELQLNKELLSDVVVGLSFQAGAMHSIGEKDAAINDRFFLGGPLSVRGFKMKGIGPRAREASLGADAFWAAGCHLYTPLPFRPGRGGFGDLFRLHCFANAGNAQNMELTSYNANEVNKMVREARWSYGLGILMMIGGIARLEVNYCIPNNAKTSDGICPGLQVGVGLNFL